MKESIAAIFPRFYNERQVASSVEYVGAVDTMLIEDGTYFVLESDGEIVGCGGWSRRDKLFTGSGDAAGDSRRLDPATEPAKVRAMFVRGDWTRRGLGRQILEACEAAARSEGFRRLALMATLPGVPLYSAFGFRTLEELEITMPDGVELACVAMDMPLDRSMTVAGTPPRVLGPTDGMAGFLGSMGVRFMIDGLDSGGGFSLVEHPMSARALAAPLHRHSREDEYSYVLEGRVGALLGDEVAEGGPGDLIFKPRGQWHTFWNAGDTPARLLEIISPAGFEQYFAELVELGGSTQAAPQDLAALGARYGLEVDPQSISELVERLELTFPGEPL
jgi:mannose-6-phosphate isomerase-like protein (cupin superfamily)/GNAT superfamily N-acetyltransferase